MDMNLPCSVPVRPPAQQSAVSLTPERSWVFKELRLSYDLVTHALSDVQCVLLAEAPHLVKSERPRRGGQENEDSWTDMGSPLSQTQEASSGPEGGSQSRARSSRSPPANEGVSYGKLAVEVEALACSASMVQELCEYIMTQSPRLYVGLQYPVFEPAEAPQNGFESVLSILTKIYHEVATILESGRPSEEVDGDPKSLLTTTAKTNGKNSPQVRWIRGLSENALIERLRGRHSQIRAYYAVLHLAKLVLAELVAQVEERNQSGAAEDNAGAPLLPFIPHALKPHFNARHWKEAVNMDAFFGKYFGFQYRSDTREVLRATLVARSAVEKAYETAPNHELSRTIAMMGYGWLFSNLTMLDQLGLSIESVNQIGRPKSDIDTLEYARTLWNLPELAPMSAASDLLGSDVAVDKVVNIPVQAFAVMRNCTMSRAVADNRVSGRPDINQKNESSQDTQTMRLSVGGDSSILSENEKELGSSPIFNRDGEKCVDDPSRSVSSQPEIMKIEFVKGRILSGMWRRFELFPSNASPPPPVISDTVNERSSFAWSDASASHFSKNDGISPAEAIDSQAEKFVETSPSKPWLLQELNAQLESLSVQVDNFLRPGSNTRASGLIIYFHGGGFISQSSVSHSTYLREWAVQLEDAVILALDYRLAPEYKYPVAVKEGVFAFEWAVAHPESLGSLARKVIIAGDSAGGNLALSVTYELMQRSTRGPDGIVLAYPALYLSPAWSASRLLSFFDPLLPTASLELCLRSYVPADMNGGSNYFLSPCLAPDEVLAQLPPVVAMCGSLDPLFDDLAYFAARLQRVAQMGSPNRNRDFFYVANAMPHGFLNMCLIDAESRALRRILGEQIRKLLESNIC
ncbi:Hormone-sensitive lipase [Porphyridium purpureum]|uniref:Hormone-sensitive lipase n=1 Tax=Porphyridium purpureum TaxID=35688 RepID=A0A5J4YY43_PORPP|nr:Hormone-sensitive lipase [Porphyridium purpureum]|eukprot:POR4323..scf209_3